MKASAVPNTGRLAGIITTAELATSGLTKSKINILVERGTLVRVGRGLYARADQVRQLTATERGKAALRVATAATIAGPESVGSHADAAAVHGIALLTRPDSDSVSVTRPIGAPRTRSFERDFIKLRVSDLPAQHRTVRYGVPITTAGRTVVDLARTTSLREGVVVADSALRIRQTTKTELYEVIDHCARWPGIAQARRAVDFSDALAESPFESIARLVFHEAGLPAPELQAWVGEDSLVVGRVDFYWRTHATIAEADGAVKYADDPGRAQHQLQRDEDLRRAGFQVVHFTWKHLHQSPDQVVQSIRAAFARNAALRKASARP